MYMSPPSSMPGRQDRHMENPKNPKTDPAERQDLQSDPRTPRPRCDKYSFPDAELAENPNAKAFDTERQDRLPAPMPTTSHAKFFTPNAKTDPTRGPDKTFATTRSTPTRTNL